MSTFLSPRRFALGAIAAVVIGAGAAMDPLVTFAGCLDVPSQNCTWLPAATMAVARSGHTATLLANGKLLVVGGATRGGPPNVLASAELFTVAPPSGQGASWGSWSRTGSLQVGRTNHTATPIGGYKVLVVGGIDGNFHSTPTAEIFDAAAGTWSPAPSMTVRRYDHTATLLPSGNVLIAGGTQVNTRLASAEIFDPSADVWLSAPAMATGRSNHTATLLPNGKVLVAGGLGASGSLASAELFDPNTSAWSPAASMSTPRASHTATLLPDGRVLVAGGTDGVSNGLATAELYDPRNNQWSPAGSLAVARSVAAAALLDSGKVLVIGGRTNGPDPRLAELYDQATNRWLPAEKMYIPRTAHTATLLPTGQVVVVGGVQLGSTEVIGDPELYQPAEITYPTAPTAVPTPATTASASPSAGGGSFTATSHMSTSRFGHTATLLKDGRVLVVGGAASPIDKALADGPPADVLASAELYDPSSNTWSPAASMQTPRYHHTATLLNTGVVLVAGGAGPTGDAPHGSLSSVELYDPVSNSWSAAAGLHNARDGHTATLLPNGRVLVAGGGLAVPSGLALASAEVYDLNTKNWTLAASMIAGRTNHTATLLNNGLVLVTGGGNAYASAERYDPTANAWSLAAPMTTGRTLHTATLLGDGKVLAAGGIGYDGPLASTELYDPKGNSWSVSGSMNTARYGQTATLLPNGQVLGMCGGGPVGGNPTAEIYDPSTGTWAATLGTENPRVDSHTATLLPSGQVLITGGQELNSALNSTEVFSPAALAHPAVHVTSRPLPSWLKPALIITALVGLAGGLAVLGLLRLRRRGI